MRTKNRQEFWDNENTNVDGSPGLVLVIEGIGIGEASAQHPGASFAA